MFSDIAARSCHPGNKLFSALFQINDLFKIPRIDLIKIPTQPTLFRASIQRPNIVRNSETEHLHDPRFKCQSAVIYFIKERQIRACPFKNNSKLLLMQLMRNNAVVFACLPAKENAHFQLRNDVFCLLFLHCIQLGHDRLELFPCICAELIVIAAIVCRTMTAICRIIVQILSCCSKHLFEGFHISLHKAFQLLKFFFMLQINLHFCIGEIRFSCPQLIQNAPIIDSFDQLNKLHVLSKKIGKFRFFAVKISLK